MENINQSNQQPRTGVGRVFNTDVKKMVNEKIVEPAFDAVKEKAKPYIQIGIAAYLVLLVLIVAILVVLLTRLRKPDLD
jgi:ascorbate-specific PTS system EIIC-type component UlaA